jgi:hypothetical protein
LSGYLGDVYIAQEIRILTKKVTLIEVSRAREN